MTRRGRSVLIAALVLTGAARVFAAGGAATQPATLPAVDLPGPGFIDETAFRQGLRTRGLTDWLRRYETDSRPADALDTQWPRRETLLARLDETQPPFYERQTIISEAAALLAEIIRQQPDHPSSLTWRFEAARDALERTDPEAFESVLLYDLPGRDRAAVARLSTEAVAILEDLRQRIDGTWRRVEDLDESGLAALQATGWLGRLEHIDHDSAMLLAWARLYAAVSADLPPAERTAALTDLLNRITEHYHWTDSDQLEPAARARVLVLAAVAARYAGRLDEADRFARQVIAIQSQQVDAHRRNQLRDESLLAVLEQIRVLRDAGRPDQALQAVDAARTWLGNVWAEDLPAALAVVLTERSILAGRTTTAPSGELVGHAQALVPLEVFASKSPRQREVVYAVLAGTLADVPCTTSLSPFARQLIAGSAVHDVLTRRPPSQRANDPRLAAVIDCLNQAAASRPAYTPPVEVGELLYLRGRALYLAGRKPPVAEALADLVEQLPEHDRADDAARQAFAVTRELLDDPAGDLVPARATFVRAARLLRKRLPNDPAAGQLTFLIADTLQQSGQLHQAADEYAAVPADDPSAGRAALSRTRCLRTLLLSAAPAGGPAPADAQTLVDETVQAARAGATRTASRPADETPDDACLAAEQVLLLADILNLPVVDAPAEALLALDGFEPRFDRCPAAVGQCLRERIVALRQLKRLAEARQVVEHYLQQEPEQAGPVMVRLLEAMHDEIEAAEDRGDAAAVRNIAGQAAELARSLLEWSDAHPDRISPADRLTIAVWRAAALLHAGRPDQALERYDECAAAADRATAPDDGRRIDIQLGRAESLLEAGKPEQALPLFADLRRGLSEETPAWWRAFVGQLRCHTAIGDDADGILQAIRQRRYLAPELGGPRYRRMIENLEQANLARTTQPAGRAVPDTSETPK